MNHIVTTVLVNPSPSTVRVSEGLVSNLGHSERSAQMEASLFFP